MLFPLAALAAPVRSLPISAPTQQVATLQNTYMGPSVSPEGEQDSIGMRIMAESTHDGYTEVVEVLAYFPVGERVYFHETPYLPCTPNKLEIISVPLSGITQKHVCVVHPVFNVAENRDSLIVSRPAAVILTDTDGEVDMFAGRAGQTFGQGQMVESIECF
ncbi:hypothetical protein C1H76_3073 [Elsinoe australis]|uniref:Uncharacterized protein n=1 Tax=Elsinoe australis TaxID=40998 RepID=A0A4U7B6T2_9PEZI|nr:hypothetical protein C1H76_3073 [Elsinoe australis]